MANLTPNVDLTERVIDNPSAVQVDNSFIIGGVVVPFSNGGAFHTYEPGKSILVRSQKELLQKFNGGQSISDIGTYPDNKGDNYVSLQNAYRLVLSSALRLVAPSVHVNILQIASTSGQSVVKYLPYSSKGDYGPYIEHSYLMIVNKTDKEISIELSYENNKYDIKEKDGEGTVIKSISVDRVSFHVFDDDDLIVFVGDEIPDRSFSNEYTIPVAGADSDPTGDWSDYLVGVAGLNNRFKIEDVDSHISSAVVTYIGMSVIQITFDNEHEITYLSLPAESYSISDNIASIKISAIESLITSISYGADQQVSYGTFKILDTSYIEQNKQQALTEAFDVLYEDEKALCTLYSDLGITSLSDYIKTCTGALRIQDDVLLRTPTMASLSGPNTPVLDDPSDFDPDDYGMSSQKASNGDQWIYHFPWKIDKTLLSFPVDISPSVLYIEAVVAARNAGHPYAGIYAHRFGVVPGSDVKVNLGREMRDRLLNLGYNCIFYDDRPRYLHTTIVSNRTCTTLNNVMNKESHRRLANKINRDIVVMAEDFIGRQITDLLYEEVTSLFKSYFVSEIMVYPESVEDYRVICDRTNNDDVDRANYIVNAEVEAQFAGEADYIKIVSTYFSVKPDEQV